MRFSCDNCNLRNNIEDFRIKLFNIIVQKEQNLLDTEVIKASQELDNLVYSCVFCNRLINYFAKLDLKNIFGTHSTFYYYGEQHLFVNICNYINEGIKNNELIYIYMEDDFYDKLLFFLHSNDISTDSIQLKDPQILIESNYNEGLIGLQKHVSNITNNLGNYAGIRWIGQPSYAIKNNTQANFLDFEKNLNKAIENTNISLLCIYDAYDFMHENKYINELVIAESLKTHSHILKNLLLKKI